MLTSDDIELTQLIKILSHFETLFILNKSFNIEGGLLLVIPSPSLFNFNFTKVQSNK